MNLDPLPPNLRELEQYLAHRPCPEPTAELRDRFLAAVRAEPYRSAPRCRSRTWSHAWRVAAAVILALNVALSAANGMRYRALPVRVAELTERAPALAVPDHPEPFAASAVARLAPAPDVGAVAQAFFEHKEY